MVFVLFFGGWSIILYSSTPNILPGQNMLHHRVQNQAFSRIAKIDVTVEATVQGSHDPIGGCQGSCAVTAGFLTGK